MDSGLYPHSRNELRYRKPGFIKPSNNRSPQFFLKNRANLLRLLMVPAPRVKLYGTERERQISVQLLTATTSTSNSQLAVRLTQASKIYESPNIFSRDTATERPLMGKFFPLAMAQTKPMDGSLPAQSSWRSAGTSGKPTQRRAMSTATAAVNTWAVAQSYGASTP